MAHEKKALTGYVSALKCIVDEFPSSLKDFRAEAKNYREMMSVPLMEFLDDDAVSIAEWFFEKSRGPTWAATGVPALIYGDVISIDRSLVMYVPSTVVGIFLPNCPSYKIIKIRYKDE